MRNAIGKRVSMRKITIETKDRWNSPASRCKVNGVRLLALFMTICLATGIASAGTSRLYPPAKDEAGALLLVQVAGVATREQILKMGTATQELLASGLKDSDLIDGSLAIGRVNCCHESTEEGTALFLYVPPNVPLEFGDLVEIRMGRQSTKTDPGAVNTAVRVREKKHDPDSQCLWDPPNNLMWGRILYCKWMPAEGWTLKNGLHKTWLKRASDANTP
jgi:hypothetical protein